MITSENFYSDSDLPNDNHTSYPYTLLEFLFLEWIARELRGTYHNNS
jgi:hypothetical protein